MNVPALVSSLRRIKSTLVAEDLALATNRIVSIDRLGGPGAVAVAEAEPAKPDEKPDEKPDDKDDKPKPGDKSESAGVREMLKQVAEDGIQMGLDEKVAMECCQEALDFVVSLGWLTKFEEGDDIGQYAQAAHEAGFVQQARAMMQERVAAKA